MQILRKDKIALIAGGIAVVLFVLFQYMVLPVWDRLGESGADLSVKEKKLEKFREVAQTKGLRNMEVSSAEARLREAERSLLTGKTVPLASAELQQLVQQLTAANSIEVRSNEFVAAKPLGSEYLQVPVGLGFQCRLEQLASLLKAIAESPKYLVVSRLSIQPTGSKDKLLGVNLQIVGIMYAVTVKK